MYQSERRLPVSIDSRIVRIPLGPEGPESHPFPDIGIVSGSSGYFGCANREVGVRYVAQLDATYMGVIPPTNWPHRVQETTQ